MSIPPRFTLLTAWLILAAAVPSSAAPPPAAVPSSASGAGPGQPGSPGSGGSAERIRVPRLIDRERPAFPPAAARAGIWDATVVVTITVHRDGSVEPLEVLECSSWGFGFEDEALRTVANWRFSPALQEGRPVEVAQAIIVRFHREARAFSI
ncbi:MAG TPA: energy transducer TonB [Verrucomicrobiae bacterium]|nr:energy transducer TonB [Verrucomicrobiae bacterium]